MIKTTIIVITFILFSLSAKAEDTTSTVPKHVAGITAGIQYRMPKFLQWKYEQFGSNIFYRHLWTSDSPTGLLYASSLFAKTLSSLVYIIIFTCNY